MIINVAKNKLMSKLMYVVFKNKQSLGSVNLLQDKLIKIGHKILPDHINPKKTEIISDDNIFISIYNPVSTLKFRDKSVCLGHVVNQDWASSSTDTNDLEGAFAIIRKNSENLQLITDAVGSRTLWYYEDKEKFISATSQLAIIYFLETYEFNEKTIPWVLSSGTLGPFLSWDRRIKMVKPNSVLNFNIKEWSYKLIEKKIKFVNLKTKFDYEQELKNNILSSLNSFDYKSNDWLLPLSGGYDSRAILLFLSKQQNSKIPTITWGARDSIYKKDNDAFVAKMLADHLGIPHQYEVTDESNERMEVVFKRFLVNGEGRIDHISAYMDGFKIWKDIYEKGYDGIIRGDEGFGWNTAWSEDQVRNSVGLSLCHDYPNLKILVNQLDEEQIIPSYYLRQKNETLAQWRDRLYHTFRIPIILSSLSDLKLSYVEVSNPLLSRSILDIVYKMPDRMRTNKRTFKRIIVKELPNIPIAKGSAINAPLHILRQKEVFGMIKKELEKSNNHFSDEFLQKVMSNMKHEALPTNLKYSDRIKSHIKSRLPLGIKSWIKYKINHSQNLDYNLLAFRIFIILKMNDLIHENL